jgi:sugar-specific transcriptional regulator TrmB
MKSTTRALKTLGLNKNQAAVYEALLELGKTPIGNVAPIAHVKRTTVYPIVKVLEKKGLVTTLTENGKQFVIPESPAILETLLQDAKQRADQLIPELMELYEGSNVKPRVMLYQGKEGMKRLYTLMLEDNPDKEIRSIGSLSNIYTWGSVLFFKNFVTKRIAKNITMKLLLVEPPKETAPKILDRYTTASNKKSLRTVRLLQKKFSFPVRFIAWGKYVAIRSSSAEGYITVLESPELTDSYNGLFSYLWEEAKPYNTDSLIPHA